MAGIQNTTIDRAPKCSNASLAAMVSGLPSSSAPTEFRRFPSSPRWAVSGNPYGSGETARKDRIMKEALRLLAVYTAGRNDIWMLAGSSKASCRAHIMSALLGVKTPQSKSGVNALRDEFYKQAGITGSCLAEQEENFLGWIKVQVL